MTMKVPQVSIIMGSDSDLPIMKQAAETLEIFGITFEITFVSAHRTPERLYTFAKAPICPDCGRYIKCS